MAAATAAEWLTAAAIGTGAFIPGALLILSLDHDLTPRMPHVNLAPVGAAVVDAGQWLRVHLAALLRLIAFHMEPQGGTR
ncbi:hypothetical protein [Streptomyces massasporeus]|uniref:hypothetical protein n=1 Tax=Streptomyces massasporeus TaxID=67324 RepID=UPI0037F9C54E